MGIDSRGLDSIDRRILELLSNQYAGQAVGLTTLAAAIGEEPENLEDVYEPYLLAQGYIVKTPRGRMLGPALRSLSTELSESISACSGREVEELTLALGGEE